jgi:putative ATP-binding cassette transporter
MSLLNEQLQHTTVLSVGHRPELEAFHSRKIVLERTRGSAKLVSDIKLIKRPGRGRFLRRFLRKRPEDR